LSSRAIQQGCCPPSTTARLRPKRAIGSPSRARPSSQPRQRRRDKPREKSKGPSREGPGAAQARLERRLPGVSVRVARLPGHRASVARILRDGTPRAPRWRTGVRRRRLSCSARYDLRLAALFLRAPLCPMPINAQGSIAIPARKSVDKARMPRDVCARTGAILPLVAAKWFPRDVLPAQANRDRAAAGMGMIVAIPVPRAMCGLPPRGMGLSRPRCNACAGRRAACR